MRGGSAKVNMKVFMSTNEKQVAFSLRLGQAHAECRAELFIKV